MKCAVQNCPNTNQKSDVERTLEFYNFPQDTEMCKIWKEKCSLSLDVNSTDIKICSDHFAPQDYECVFELGISMRKLKSTAFPHVNLNCLKQPTFEEIKSAANENTTLKKQLEALQKENIELLKNIQKYDACFSKRKVLLTKTKQQYEKLKKKYSNNRGNRDLLSKVFSDSQIGILMGRKKVIWSDDDLAMAFTLRQMGSKECYLYLKETLNFPLPALSCVQKWVASKPLSN